MLDVTESNSDKIILRIIVLDIEVLGLGVYVGVEGVMTMHRVKPTPMEPCLHMCRTTRENNRFGQYIRTCLAMPTSSGPTAHFPPAL